MKLAKIDGTICKKCYAGKGCYVFPVVKAMYEKRYQAIEMNRMGRLHGRTYHTEVQKPR